MEPFAARQLPEIQRRWAKIAIVALKSIDEAT
jgi:hypothetical protein